MHQLLHGAWPALPCSCSGSPAGFSPAPPGAALEHRSGQHQVDGAHQLLHGAWPAPPCSCN
ncbi:hypothetical protein ACWYXJ_29625 [Janthinobacterium lividum]